MQTTYGTMESHSSCTSGTVLSPVLEISSSGEMRSVAIVFFDTTLILIMSLIDRVHGRIFRRPKPRRKALSEAVRSPTKALCRARGPRRQLPRRIVSVLTNVLTNAPRGRLTCETISHSKTIPTFHPEYGRYMLESTPGSPFNGSVRDLLSVERDMRYR